MIQSMYCDAVDDMRLGDCYDVDMICDVRSICRILVTYVAGEAICAITISADVNRKASDSMIDEVNFVGNVGIVGAADVMHEVDKPNEKRVVKVRQADRYATRSMADDDLTIRSHWCALSARSYPLRNIVEERSAEQVVVVVLCGDEVLQDLLNPSLVVAGEETGCKDRQEMSNSWFIVELLVLRQLDQAITLLKWHGLVPVDEIVLEHLESADPVGFDALLRGVLAIFSSILALFACHTRSRDAGIRLLVQPTAHHAESLDVPTQCILRIVHAPLRSLRSSLRGL